MPHTPHTLYTSTHVRTHTFRARRAGVCTSHSHARFIRTSLKVSVPCAVRKLACVFRAWAFEHTQPFLLRAKPIMVDLFRDAMWNGATAHNTFALGATYARTHTSMRIVVLWECVCMCEGVCVYALGGGGLRLLCAVSIPSCRRSARFGRAHLLAGFSIKLRNKLYLA